MLALQAEDSGVKINSADSFRGECSAESVLHFVNFFSDLFQVFLIFFENVFDLFLAGLTFCIFPEFVLELAGFLSPQAFCVALVVDLLRYSYFPIP